jgi:hypothetical protein
VEEHKRGGEVTHLLDEPWSQVTIPVLRIAGYGNELTQHLHQFTYFLDDFRCAWPDFATDRKITATVY